MNLHIKNLKRHAETGVVTSILWVASLADPTGKVRVEVRGEKVLVPKDPSDPSFVPYQNITLDTAETWLKLSLGQDGLQNIEGELNALLKDKTAPAIVSGNPWDAEEKPAEPPLMEAPVIARRTRFPVPQSE